MKFIDILTGFCAASLLVLLVDFALDDTRRAEFARALATTAEALDVCLDNEAKRVAAEAAAEATAREAAKNAPNVVTPPNCFLLFPAPAVPGKPNVGQVFCDASTPPLRGSAIFYGTQGAPATAPAPKGK